MVNYKTWMKDIDNNVSIGKLAIPGTHNSAACHTALPSVQCQGESVTEQLEHGVRFLDVRVGKKFVDDDGSDLQVIHGKFPVKIPFPKMFSDVLDEVYDFVDKNKSETVILSIKQEGEDSWNNDKDEFGNFIWDKYVNKHKNKWFLKNEVPKLGDARGKVILFRRFGVKNQDRAKEFGFNAPSWQYNTTEDDRGAFVVQDYCELGSKEDVDKKIGYVKNLTKRASEYNKTNNDPKLFVNFCSGSNFFNTDCWPQKISEAMADGGIKDVFSKGAGIIVMDYVEAKDWKLVKDLVDKNF